MMPVLAAAMIGILAGPPRRRRARTPQVRSLTPLRPCPVCATPIPRGEKVSSKVIDGHAIILVHLRGCPACYRRVAGPDAAPQAKRRSCPNCRAELDSSGHLIGRMWEEGGTTYVRISGCNECSPDRVHG